MSRIKLLVKTLVLRTLDFLYPSYLFRVRKNKIVCSSFRGQKFSGNSAEVVKSLLQTKVPLDIVWLALDVREPVPQGVRVVKYNSLKSYYELSTARVWIDDFRKRYFPRKKASQVYYQLWHGSLPLKKIEKDASTKLEATYVSDAKRDGYITDFMVAGSKFAAEIYKSAFWMHGKVLMLGTPTVDKLFTKPTEGTLLSLRASLGLRPNERIVLYCPTFRETFSLGDYTLNSEKLLQELANVWGGEWRLLIRLHPNARTHEPEVVAANPGSLGVTGFPNVEDLIIASDLVITDFSSVMFEGLYADTPTFILAKDYDAYVASERGVYDIINHLPFTIAHSNYELIDSVSAFVERDYLKNRQDFLTLIGSVENGHAAQGVAASIIRNME
ncbi:CDP-glycerol glycerophosphotransferase family protein [Lacticaseibacillus suilingensis]|uniref:CDP-glycerol glycerophosphotransferase family protein n=1 Tax=Lacticaseibacillus suilingensis TaxID=2799577 RepID=A0ABW4BIQ7_9LACO|nr:CDP-glycerol glycerophosphotransferase family protein [Lacticaseibacillus suilingensis]